MKDFVFYIDHDFFDETNFLDHNFSIFFESSLKLFDTIRFLKADAYFFDFQVKKVAKTIRDIDEFFSQSQGNKIDILLRDFLPQKKFGHLFNVIFSRKNTSLALYSEHKIDNSRSPIILKHNDVGLLSLLDVVSNEDFSKISIPSFNCHKKLWNFINEELKPVYNFSKKHGDNTKKAISPNGKKVSQLLTCKEETQVLLKNSIFDLREHSWRYNFDYNRNTYIIFPNENALNQFHAYHILESEWEKEIPKTIRNFFKK